MTEVPIIQKPVNWFAKSMDWFPYDRDLRHKRVKSSYSKVKCILKNLQFAEAPSHVAATILVLHCVSHIPTAFPNQ